MIVHFTDKLRKKLHIPELTTEEVRTGKHLRWYANLFTAQRVQYILTTNASSLFSVVIFGGGVTDDSLYLQRFLGELRDHLDDLDMLLIYDRVIAPKTGAITLAKTASRSVLGSMNDMVNICKYKFDIDDAGPWQASQVINDTPFTINGYKYPRDAFAQMPLD